MIEAKLRDLEPSGNDKFECSPGRKRKQLEGRPNVNCAHEENPWDLKKIPIGFADKIYLKIYHTGFK